MSKLSKDEKKYEFLVINEIIQVMIKLQSLRNILIASPEADFWDEILEDTDELSDNLIKISKKINESLH